MGKDAILSEIAKLTASQRKTLRRLISALSSTDRVAVRIYDQAATVFVERANRRLFVRMTPRGRALEARTWEAA